MSGSPEEIAAAELGDVYAGSRWPAEGVLVLAFTRDAVRHGEDLRRRTGAEFTVELARFSAQELDALEERLGNDLELLEAEGIRILSGGTDRNRLNVEVATARPAETMAWLYERYGPALQVTLVGPDAYQPRLIAVTGYRETEPGIEVRYSANGDFVRVELVEGDDAVAPRARRRVPELAALPALVRTL